MPAVQQLAFILLRREGFSQELKNCRRNFLLSDLVLRPVLLDREPRKTFRIPPAECPALRSEPQNENIRP